MDNRLMKEHDNWDINPLECSGRCGAFNRCMGPIKKVTVYSSDKKRNWGTCYYCDTAIIETKEMGYVVIPADSSNPWG